MSKLLNHQPFPEINNDLNLSKFESISSDDTNNITNETEPLPQPSHAQIFERSVQDCSCTPLSRRLTVCKEDFIPSTLDATTQIFTNNTNLDDVEMIYSRRNSSVVGLQSALGRSRKNSFMSMSGDTNNSNNHLNNGKRSPQLKSSKSQLNFFSYVDLINNDEFAKKSRPRFNSSYSSGIIPTKKSPLASTQFAGKFMISPESSGDEGEDDNKSLISSSMGECLREARVEINH